MTGSGRILALLGLCVAPMVGAGCAAGTTSNTGCTTALGFNVSPPSATLDHLSTGNQVQFKWTAAPYVVSGSGCALPAVIAVVQNVTWTNPDPTDISISSANDPTNGTATCTGVTNGAVTLTGTASMGTESSTKSVQLTCK